MNKINKHVHTHSRIQENYKLKKRIVALGHHSGFGLY